MTKYEKTVLDNKDGGKKRARANEVDNKEGLVKKKGKLLIDFFSEKDEANYNCITLRKPGNQYLR